MPSDPRTRHPTLVHVGYPACGQSVASPSAVLGRAPQVRSLRSSAAPCIWTTWPPIISTSYCPTLLGDTTYGPIARAVGGPSGRTRMRRGPPGFQAPDPGRPPGQPQPVLRPPAADQLLGLLVRALFRRGSSGTAGPGLGPENAEGLWTVVAPDHRVPLAVERRADLTVVVRQPGQVTERVLEDLLDLHTAWRADRRPSRQWSAHHRAPAEPRRRGGHRRAYDGQVGQHDCLFLLAPRGRVDHVGAELWMGHSAEDGPPDVVRGGERHPPGLLVRRPEPVELGVAGEGRRDLQPGALRQVIAIDHQ
jgi:hypothetical protein